MQLKADEVAFQMFEAMREVEDTGFILDGLVVVGIFSSEDDKRESFVVDYKGSTYRAIGAIRMALHYLEETGGIDDGVQ